MVIKKQEMGKYRPEWCQKWQYLQWKCNEIKPTRLQ